jgi:hypothetical protein
MVRNFHFGPQLNWTVNAPAQSTLTTQSTGNIVQAAVLQRSNMLHGGPPLKKHVTSKIVHLWDTILVLQPATCCQVSVSIACFNMGGKSLTPGPTRISSCFTRSMFSPKRVQHLLLYLGEHLRERPEPELPEILQLFQRRGLQSRHEK